MQKTDTTQYPKELKATLSKIDSDIEDLRHQLDSIERAKELLLSSFEKGYKLDDFVNIAAVLN